MGDNEARNDAARAAHQAFRTQALLEQRVQQQDVIAAKDADRAQRIMMRSLRGAGGGFFSQAGNNTVLGDSSGVLG